MTLIRPPVKLAPTELTVPEEHAEPVPLTTPLELTLRHCVEPVMEDSVRPEAVALPRLGVTKDGEVVSEIAPEPFTFWPSAATTPVPVVIVLGAPPAPPPMTKAFNASAAGVDAICVESEKYGMPPLCIVPLTVSGKPKLTVPEQDPH